MASYQQLILMSQEALDDSLEGNSDTPPPRANNFVFQIKARNVHADTTATGKVQHSPDGTVWFDLVSFTAIAGVNGNELKVPTVPVLTFLRAVVTLAGATKLADIDIVAHFDPKASA